MDVTDQDVAQIPPRNLHVPREQFAAVWRAAENPADPSDWYTAGVAITCRWLAGATVRPDNGQWFLAPAPVTRSRNTAYEELIDAECIEAEVRLHRRPAHVWMRTRPGFLEGILATLFWAWRRTAGPPLEPATRPTG